MNEEATASDSPLIQGRNARLYGKGRESCPYGDGSEEGVGWLQGFDGYETAVTAPDPDDGVQRG